MKKSLLIIGLFLMLSFILALNPKNVEGSDISINGNVVIKSAKNGNIVVLVSDSNQNKNLLFRFAPKVVNKKIENLDIYIQNVKVFYSDRRIAILQDNEVVLSLSLEVSNFESNSIYVKNPKDRIDVFRITKGIGLKVEKVEKIENISEIDFEKDFVYKQSEVKTLAGCSSGGTGSTGCSVDCPNGAGCSVTCTSGTHSCCNCPRDCGCVLGPEDYQ